MNIYALVRPVHVGDEARHARTEGHAAGDLVDIGAAAGGDALALAAGVGLIAAQQRGDKLALGGGVVGRGS